MGDGALEVGAGADEGAAGYAYGGGGLEEFFGREGAVGEHGVDEFAGELAQGGVVGFGVFGRGGGLVEEGVGGEGGGVPEEGGGAW